MKHRTAFIALLLATSAFAAPLPTTKVTIDVKNAELTHLFRAIAEKANADLVVDDCADTKLVTVKLRNVQLNELVAFVSEQYQLDVRYDGKILNVACR